MKPVPKTRHLAVVAIALALLGTSHLALAQVQQLQLGRPNDANPMVGGYHSNEPIRGYAPINGNDIITGNVSGLQYFHGSSVGTFSPYTFQGNLGTSSLAGFARQSAGGSSSGSAINQSYYLPSSTVSTAQGNMYSAPYGGGFDSRLVPPTAVSPLVSRSQYVPISPDSEGNQTSWAIDRSLSYAPAAGEPGAVLTSPLFGQRINEIVLQQEMERNQKPVTGEQVPASQPGTVLPGATRPFARNDTVAQDATGREDPRVTGQSSELTGASRTPATKPLADLRIGDTYRTLQEDLRKAQEAAAANDSDTETNAQTIRGSNLMTDIDPLTGYPRKVAAVRNAAGSTSRPATTGPSATSPAMDPRKDANVPSLRLEDLPISTLTAGAKLKPLNSFVRTDDEKKSATTEVLLGQGEQAMKTGKFMDAIDSYEQVIARDPANVLALVGRAHAELGAGMFQSAAYDLKFAFTRNPQMISVRYELSSFIPMSRQDSLLRDLTKLATGKDPGNVGSFLLCYLDYQLGRGTQLQSELKSWTAKDSKDSWRTVAQRAWTATEPVTAPATKP